MAPRKQIVTLNDAPSKGKAISAIGGTVPSPAIDQPSTTEDAGSSSPHGATTSVQLPQQREDQFLQMPTDMKE